MNGVMVALSEDGLDLESSTQMVGSKSHEVFDNFLRWLIHKIELLKLFWLVLESSLGLLIEVIILIVDVLKLDEADSGNLLPFLMFLKEFDHSVALLDKEALVSQS